VGKSAHASCRLVEGLMEKLDNKNDTKQKSARCEHLGLAKCHQPMSIVLAACRRTMRTQQVYVCHCKCVLPNSVAGLKLTTYYAFSRTISKCVHVASSGSACSPQPPGRWHSLKVGGVAQLCSQARLSCCDLASFHVGTWQIQLRCRSMAGSCAAG
jgi:hypothetical protein